MSECAEALNALIEAYKGYREVRDIWDTMAVNLGLDPTMWSSDLYRNLATGEVRFEDASLCREVYCVVLREFVEVHIRLSEKRRELDAAVKEARVTCEPTRVREVTVE